MFRIVQRYKNQTRLDLQGIIEENRYAIRLINPRHLTLPGLDSEVTFEVPANHSGPRLPILECLFYEVQEKFERIVGLRHRDRTLYFANF